MVHKHFQDKEQALIRAERAHDQNLRKIAAFCSKEIRGFWGNVQKLSEFRLNTQIEGKKKQALDQHLNFIVEKTEKFSTMLADSMADNAASSLRTTPNTSEAEPDDNDEYEPDQNSDDDEATINKGKIIDINC